MAHPELHVFSQPSEVMVALAQWLQHEAESSVRDRGMAHWAISGGSTPIGLYQLLAKDGAGIPWDKVQLFFADERDVYPGDPLSSFGMVQATLLRQRTVVPRRVYPWPTTIAPQESLAFYRAALAPLPRADKYPVLDAILLGMGADGHTASVFPQSPQQQSTDWVAYGPGPAVWRYTLTLPVLVAARRVVFLVTGADKRQRVRQCLSGDNLSLPAAWVSRQAAEVHWFLDEASASDL